MNYPNPTQLTRKDRFRAAVRYIKASGIATTMKDMAGIVGCSPQSFSSAHNGDERYLNTIFLTRFNDAFGNIFSIDWLLNGNGDMLASGVHGPVNSSNIIGNGNSVQQQVHEDPVTAQLRTENEFLRKRVGELERRIEKLEEDKQFLKSLINKYYAE